jgi:ELWxxDGT repeat protein
VLPVHRRSALLALAAAALAAEAGAQTARLVKDVEGPNGSSSPVAVTAGLRAYFSANGPTGPELWQTDGTRSFTRLVATFPPASQIELTGDTPFGDIVYFVVRDSLRQELWRTDGTPQGTFVVDSTAEPISGLTAVGGALFYVRGPSIHPRFYSGLYRTNVQTGGVTLVTGAPGIGGLANVNGMLFFSQGGDPNAGVVAGTYKTDGGTPQLVTPRVGFGGIAAGGLYFASNVSELWRTDGTSSGTFTVRSGLANILLPLKESHGIVYFAANDGISGSEPWRSDGTVEGTLLLRDVNPGPDDSMPGGFTPVIGAAGALTLFSAYDGVTGRELWRTDGSAAGTLQVMDVFPGPGFSFPSGLVRRGVEAYFNADDGAHGFELWRSDGTAAGTTLVRDIRPGPLSSNPSNLASLGAYLVFAADDGVHGAELWRTEGTSANTTMVLDVSAAGLRPAQLTRLGGKVVFSGDDGLGRALWASDGTAAGTQRLGASNPTELRDIAGTLFFTSASAGAGLWKSDGTPGGTTLVSSTATPKGIAGAGAAAFFSNFTSSAGEELWRSDGSAAGTALVRDILPGAGSSAPSSLTALGSTLFFSAADTATDRELWKSDGTVAGTVRVKDIRTGAPGSDPSELVVAGGVLFFVADDGAAGRELWRSDGTDAGTVRVKDIATGAPGSGPSLLTAVGDTLYFRANDGVHGVELWKSDGTEAGTVLVKDIGSIQASSNPESLTNVNGMLFFGANRGFGRELWKSDGTAAGTVRVGDVSLGFDKPWIAAYASGALFQAWDQVHGAELWRTDGIRTVRVTDLVPGAGSSLPREMVGVGGDVFFAAGDGERGRELWLATSNDAFAQRELLQGVRTSVYASTLGDTKETGEPDHAGQPGGRSAWWSWTAPRSGRFAVTTAGSDLDTLLAVYTGSDVGSLTLVASNDDERAGVPTSRVVFRAAAGAAYALAVDGKAGADGHVSLALVPLLPAAADLNGDDRSDLVWRAVGGPATGALFLWMMQGKDITLATYLDPISADWQLQFSGDFNGDGRSDLLWRQAGTGATFLWMMSGSETAAGTGYAAAQADERWQLQRVGDFDGDGKADLLWRNVGGPDVGALFVWLMDGTGIKGATYLDPISTAWQVQRLGDFNGDGKADILWRHTGNGETYIWMMDGPRVSAGTGYTNHAADNRWRIENVGDFDGDGRSDILWRNVGGPDTGALFVWLMDGTTRVGTYLDPISTDWQVESTTDLDGDGRSDILWRNRNPLASDAGKLYVWIMDGARVANGTGYTNSQADFTWQVQAPR